MKKPISVKNIAWVLLILNVAIYLFAYPDDGINWFVNSLVLIVFAAILLLFNKNLLQKETPKDYSRWFIGGILLVTSLLYLPALTNGFSNWDDPEYVISNPLIRDFSITGLIAIFYEPFKGIYQPISLLSLMVDYVAAGLNPGHYHLTNILLHIANTFLVFLILRKIIEKKAIAIIGMALFAIHPLQTESVVWITERKNVLFTCFYLFSILQYLNYTVSRKKVMLLFSLILFAFSLLTKPQGVMLAPVLIFLDYAIKRKIRIRENLVEKSGFFFLALVAGLFVLNNREGTTIDRPVFDQVIFAGFAFSKYIYQIVVPVKLSALYPYPEKLQIVHYLGFIFFILCLVTGIWALKKNRIVAFGLWFFVLNIILLVQFIPLNYFLMADRYNYLPSFGLFIMLAILFHFLMGRCKSKAMIRYLISLLALVLIFSSTVRIKIWGNDLDLWNDVLEKYPDQPEALNNRGHAWYFLNEPQKAINDYNKAISIDPELSISFVNRGVLLMDNQQYNEALQDFNKALELFPEHATAFVNRGIINNRQGNKIQAMQDYNSAISLNPLMEEAYINRGVLHQENGAYTKSVEDFTHALTINPDNALTYSNRGLSNARNGNKQAALADFNHCIAIDPSFVDAYSNRGFIRYKLGMYNEAIVDFSYAIKLRPQFATAYMNRGLAYIESGKPQLACPDFQTALQLGINAAREQLEKHCLNN